MMQKKTKNLSKSKIKEIEKNLLDFEKSFSKLKKYHDYDDHECRGIRDIISHLVKIITNQQKPSVILIIRIIT